MLELLLSIPKSLYVSAKLFSFKDAFRLPCLVRYDCVVKSLSGTVKHDGPVRKGMLSFGFVCIDIVDKRSERSILSIDGVLELGGTANFGAASRMNVGKSAVLKLGDGFVNTSRTTIICQNLIEFGNNALVSWDTLFIDTDFHNVLDLSTNTTSVKSKPIVMGDNVWVGARATILKGAVLPDGSIVGASSLVNKAYEQPDCLIAGNPATVRKTGCRRAE